MRTLGQSKEEPPKEAPQAETVVHPVPEVMKPEMDEIKEQQDNSTSVGSMDSKHFVTIIPTVGDYQKYTEFAKCKCGWEGRFLSMDEAANAADHHIKINS